MSLRQLALQLLLAAAALVAINAAVTLMARTSVPRQLLRHGEQSDPATDLFLGNSTMAAALNERVFAVVKPGRPLNLALGATGPVEHCLIWRLQSKHRVADVYYGFFDSQLTDPLHGTWETLVGNRAMAYYVDPDTAIDYYARESPFKALGMRLTANVPVMVERLAIWSKVEKLRRAIGEIGMPKRDVNRFGRADDFTLLEADSKEFARRCERAVAERQPLSPPIAEIIDTTRVNGARIRVVEMPMPAEHRRRLNSSHEWRSYRNHVIELIHNAGGDYVDASNWIDDVGFADNVHLNAAGAAQFSTRLGKWASQNR